MVEHAWNLDLCWRGRHLDGVEVPDPLAWAAYLQPLESWPGLRLRCAGSEAHGAAGSVVDPARSVVNRDLCSPDNWRAVDRVGAAVGRPRAGLHGWVGRLYCTGACPGARPLHGRQLARGADVRT